MTCHAMSAPSRLVSSRLVSSRGALLGARHHPPLTTPGRTHPHAVCMHDRIIWGYCVHPRLPPGLPDNRRQMIQMLQIPNSKYQMPGEERRSLLAHPSRPTRTQADGRKWPAPARPARVRSARVPLAGEAETSGGLLLAARAWSCTGLTHPAWPDPT